MIGDNKIIVHSCKQTQTSTIIFYGVFEKRNKSKKLKRITIAKSKAKEKLRKVKNLLMLPRQRRHKMFLWWQLYSLKCHSLGIQAQSDVVREVFPTRVTRGYYQTLGEA
jgi:hypothetical protein